MGGPDNLRRIATLEQLLLLNDKDLSVHAFGCSCFIRFTSIKDNQYSIDCSFHCGPAAHGPVHNLQAVGYYVHMWFETG